MIASSSILIESGVPRRLDCFGISVTVAVCPSDIVLKSSLLLPKPSSKASSKSSVSLFGMVKFLKSVSVDFLMMTEVFFLLLSFLPFLLKNGLLVG